MKYKQALDWQMTNGIKGTKGGEERGPIKAKEKTNEKNAMDKRREMNEKKKVTTLHSYLHFSTMYNPANCISFLAT